MKIYFFGSREIAEACPGVFEAEAADVLPDDDGGVHVMDPEMPTYEYADTSFQRVLARFVEALRSEADISVEPEDIEAARRLTAKDLSFTV